MLHSPLRFHFLCGRGHKQFHIEALKIVLYFIYLYFPKFDTHFPKQRTTVNNLFSPILLQQTLRVTNYNFLLIIGIAPDFETRRESSVNDKITQQNAADKSSDSFRGYNSYQRKFLNYLVVAGGR